MKSTIENNAKKEIMEMQTVQNLVAHKIRVQDFEKDYAQSIVTFAENEKRFSNLNKLRIKWLQTTTTVEDMDTQIFDRKVEILKQKADVCKIKLVLDGLHVTSCYESEHLKQLVLGTRPREARKDDESRRVAELNALQRESATTLQLILQQSHR